MTESEMRARVVSAARAWYDAKIKEADGSHLMILNYYNNIRPLPRGYAMQPTDPWCAAFVSAVGASCGLTDVILPECACDPMIALYRARGRWHEADDYPAKPGDLIFYDWQDSGAGDCTGSADHVGLIVEDIEHYFRVIEGNVSDTVGMRTIAHNSRYIRGFAVPNYASKAESAGAAQSDEAQTGKTDAPATADGQQEAAASVQRETCTVTLPVLRRGDGIDDPDEAVRAAQELLKLRGFRCGAAGSDGEFGDMTEEAAQQFKRVHGLTADGVIGPETWAALLGVT